VGQLAKPKATQRRHFRMWRITRTSRLARPRHLSFRISDAGLRHRPRYESRYECGVLWFWHLETGSAEDAENDRLRSPSDARNRWLANMMLTRIASVLSLASLEPVTMVLSADESAQLRALSGQLAADLGGADLDSQRVLRAVEVEGRHLPRRIAELLIDF